MNTLDCAKCGACCIDQLIALMPGDNVPAHMTIDMARANVEHPGIIGGMLRACTSRAMGQQLGRCIALVGRVGIKVSCSIYDRRPKVCSTLVPGSWPCEEVRGRLLHRKD